MELVSGDRRGLDCLRRPVRTEHQGIPEEVHRWRRCLEIDTVVIDGMKIKKYMEYDPSHKEHVGFVNYGEALDLDSETLTTEAIVIMAVGLHGNWKLLHGYVLVNGISASSQEQLLIQTYEMLYDSGVYGVSFTLDGHQTNMSTIRKLGCSTNPEDLMQYFPHPRTGAPVYVFLDACHALKLIRNQFCSLKNIYGRTARRICSMASLREIEHHSKRGRTNCCQQTE